MITAIIGAGSIGKVHAEVLSLLGFEISAICDIDSQAAEELRAEFAKDASIYTDWQTMLDDLKPDIVHICTPHYLHAPMIIEALDRGINVLCEKPLCISYDEIDRILEAEKRSSAQLGVSFQNRYLKTNQFVKNYIKDKEIISAHGSVAWHRDAKYYSSSKWRGTIAEEGGGVLINQAIHTLDLLEWFCGEPESVCASGNNFSLREVIEVEDTLYASFSGKHPFTFFATNSNAHNLPITIQIKLSNKDDILVLPNCVIINDELKFNVKSEKLFGKACYGIGHELLIRDFYSCVENKRPFSINGKEASKVMRLVLSAYQSKDEQIKIQK